MPRELSPEEVKALGLDDDPAPSPSPAPAGIPAAPVARFSPPPQRSGMQHAADTFSDLLPGAGAAIGGAVAMPEAMAAAPFTMGASALLVPAAGMLGHSGGTALKRLLDNFTGRNNDLTAGKPYTGHDMLDGANAAMMQEGGGQLLGAAARSHKEIGDLLSRYMHDAPLADEAGQQLGRIGGKAVTPFSGLTDDTFGKVRQSAARAPVALSAPVGKLAQKGFARASPALAQSTRMGADVLENIAGSAESRSAPVLLGRDQAARLPAIQQGLKDTIPAGVEADSAALDHLRELLRYDYTPGDAAGWMRDGLDPPGSVNLPPGENVVNEAFNSPEGNNKVLADLPARQKIGAAVDVKMQRGAFGDAKRKVLDDIVAGSGSGVTPEAAEGLARDVPQLTGIAKSLRTQRGGAQLLTGKRGIELKVPGVSRIADAVGGMLDNPARRPFLGAESPAQAARFNTPRLLELEAERRGIPLDPGNEGMAINRSQALNGVNHPVSEAVGGAVGDALGAFSPAAAKRTGQLFPTLLQLLNAERQKTTRE